MFHYAFVALATLTSAVMARPATPDLSNISVGAVAADASTFWYANMDHTGNARGYAPDLDDDYNYPVYKAVEAGDGGSIQDVITSASNGEKRHGQWLASQPRVGFCGKVICLACLTRNL